MRKYVSISNVTELFPNVSFAVLLRTTLLYRLLNTDYVVNII